MSNPMIEAIRKRRTQYVLGRSLPLPAGEVEALIKEAVKLAPSSFNSQSSRVAILFGEASVKLWRITEGAVEKVAPPETFAATKTKLGSFAAGAGTILFFEDQDVVKGMQAKFALYADKFPIWSEQASGMAQFAVWSALADAGIGASLQHYNPLIDAEVAATWGLPPSWLLRAQMPFGSNEKPFAEKTFMDDSQRFKVFS